MTALIIIALLVTFLTGINAWEVNESVFLYQNKKIIINDDTLDYYTKKMIAEFVAEDVAPASIYAINCLLGHSLAYTTSLEIAHNVRTGGQNCDENFYEIEYCTRNCGYIVKTLISSIPISHCHG